MTNARYQLVSSTDMDENFEFGPISGARGRQSTTTKHSNDAPFDPQIMDRDSLNQLGKRQVLKRNFGFMSILGFSCTILITWEAALIVFSTALVNGGPAGMIYGFIVVWIGTMSIYMSLGELTSMAPTAGGQYHWVSMLAPSRSNRFLSYITGWLTVTGWQGALVSAIYVSATLIQGVAVLLNPSYTPQPWHTVLIYFAITAFAVVINTVISSLLPAFEGLILVLHVLGFIAILFPMLFLADHTDASFVFGQFLNMGNFPTQGLSFFVGLLGNVFAFGGADGAVHMSEEIKNASVVVPRSIMASMLINGSLGLGIIIATLFCLGNIDDALSSPTGLPFMEILTQATGSTVGAAVMISIIIVMQLSADVGLLASCSRMTWSFARDHGMPGWQIISRVDSRTSIPINAVLFSSLVGCLLSLIILGSSSAFNNLVSIGVVGLYASYFSAASLLLYKRCTRAILEPFEVDSSEIVNTIGAKMVWGPWRFRGPVGIAINAFACVYIVVIIFFSLWPPELPVTSENMQYSVVIFGAVIIGSSIWYLVHGSKEYKGPLVEIEKE